MAYFFISFFVFMTYFGTSLVFAAESLPQKMVGNWALPDCRAPEELLIQSEFFSLELNGSKAKLSPIKSVTNASDYTIVASTSKNTPMRVFNDGILEVATLETPTSTPHKNSWDELEIDQRHEYSRCLTIEPSIHEVGISALKKLDALHLSCEASDAKHCREEIFKTIDKNKNQKISVSELSQAIHTLLYITRLNDQSFQDMENVLSHNYKISAEISELLLESNDHDGSKSLSFDESEKITLAFDSKQTTKAMHQSIDRLLELFPTLRQN